MDDRFFQNLLENLYDGVYYVDRNRIITYWNTAAERITGFKREDVIGRSCAANILRHIDENGVELCKHACPLAATLRDGQKRETSVYLHHQQGHRLPVSVRVTPVFAENDQVVGGVEVFNENSHFRQIQQDLEAMRSTAFHDELTGVGNRRAAERALQTRLYELRNFEVPFGLVFLDLDSFKKVNDLHGHPIGDQVLRMAANSIISALRHNDAIARWGGEEFIVLFSNVETTQLEKLAQRIRIFIERSFLMVENNEKLAITASLGATLARPDDTLESLVQRADALMYASKQAGRNRVTIG
jgi:diguanylate cyclase (GGDEF)-like protein/PAS domain S-box-containing protein